jgi:hypothetical protein
MLRLYVDDNDGVVDCGVDADGGDGIVDAHDAAITMQ